MSYKRGQLVDVFSDAIFCESFEGRAILLEEISGFAWEVQFISNLAGDTAVRMLPIPKNGHPEMLDADLFFMLTGERLNED